MARVIQGLERRERRMQTEEAIQIDRGLRRAVRLGNSDRRAQFVVTRLSERNHHVEAVYSAALENRNQDFLAAAAELGSINRARKPFRHRANAENGEG